MALRVLTVVTGTTESGETNEDHLLLAGISGTEEFLSEQQIHEMLGLPANATLAHGSVPADLSGELDARGADYLGRIEKRNTELFHQESEKLDRWAEDERKAHKARLDDLDAAIKAARRETREASSLAESIQKKKAMRELERQRATIWKEFDDECVAIERKRDMIEADAVRMLSRSTSSCPLFTVSWSLI